MSRDDYERWLFWWQSPLIADQWYWQAKQAWWYVKALRLCRSSYTMSMFLHLCQIVSTFVHLCLLVFTNMYIVCTLVYISVYITVPFLFCPFLWLWFICHLLKKGIGYKWMRNREGEWRVRLWNLFKTNEGQDETYLRRMKDKMKLKRCPLCT